ncbi:hypothetical protein BDZ97DRAFT_1895247 [Flammula alnicola]|nr:hypothetical protein BDZ97DRAFT_1895247 [Flammula alnicola]
MAPAQLGDTVNTASAGSATQPTPPDTIPSGENPVLKSTTPRNLCKIDWSKKNIDGSNADFAAYWKSLKGTPEEQLFINKSKSLSAASLKPGRATRKTSGIKQQH